MKQRILSLAVLCIAAFALSACSDDDKHGGHGGEVSYAIGDLYNVNGVKGIVYKLDDTSGTHGLIVSLDETTAAWSTLTVRTEADDDDNGADNQAVIEALTEWQTDYPAFAWCASKNVDGVTGWYMPAYFEVKSLYQVWAADKDAFNKFLTDNGGTEIIATSPAIGYYWSSTEVDSEIGTTFATAYMFSQDVADFPLKSEVHKVRAVHKF